MEKYPLVSIVTPTYNQADFLAETIESVLAQDYPNIEYIVIDDGSTDGTPDVLRSFTGLIRYERQENMGQALTLNKGWESSRGTYLGYLSSDDVLYPQAITQIVDQLLRDESTVCVYPDSNLIDAGSRIIKRNVCRPFDLPELVVRQECYIGPGALFKRSAFNIVGGWRPDLKLAPDREFWIRLAGTGGVEMCPLVLAGYRMHPSSVSYKCVSEDVSKEYLQVLDEYFDSGAVPEDIAYRRSEAYGFATMLVARNCFRAGHLRRGLALYREACQLHPELKKLEYRMRVLRNVVSRPLRSAAASAHSVIAQIRNKL